MNFKTFLKGLQWTATSGAYFEPCQTSMMENIVKHCMKSVRVRSYFGPDFPIFGLNTERYGVSQCNCLCLFLSKPLHSIFWYVACPRHRKIFDQYLANVTLLYLLKSPENLLLSSVFIRCKMETLARNRLR